MKKKLRSRRAQGIFHRNYSVEKFLIKISKIHKLRWKINTSTNTFAIDCIRLQTYLTYSYLMEKIPERKIIDSDTTIIHFQLFVDTIPEEEHLTFKDRTVLLPKPRKRALIIHLVVSRQNATRKLKLRRFVHY